MEEINQNEKQSPKFDILPFKFKEYLKRSMGQFQYGISGHELEDKLLYCINNELISLGNSPIYKDRIKPDSYEWDVWYEDLKGIPSELVLVYMENFEKYLLCREIDLSGTIIDEDNPNIIYDLKEILAVMVKTKKENNKLFGQLPYLGIQNDDSRLLLFEEEIIRPNYDEIKSDRLISLKNCICILIGIDNLSLIARIEKDLDNLSEFDRVYEKNWMIASSSFRPEEIYFEALKLVMKYREEWKDIVSLICEFEKKISVEVQAGFIERFDFSDSLGDHSIDCIDKEIYRFKFKTLPFLKWAKESGYDIPDELSFIENADGILQWADSDKHNDIEPDNINNLVELSGKDRQELGRLKTEKITMDLTVKAAIVVGTYIEKAKTEGRLIVKDEIIDLVNGIDSKIPSTRIDLIWKSIPDKIKSGPGRPKKI